MEYEHIGRELIEFADDSNETLSEEKIKKIKESSNKVVVFTTDWTTETVVNQINKGNINLNPEFQRRDAWQRSRKSKFIESLFLGLPVPQIVLAESKTDKGKYLVIDGKQRLLAIMQFYGGNELKFGSLNLSGLEILKALNGKNKQKLNNRLYDGDDYIDVSAFENQSIRTVVVRNWSDEAVLYEIFLRLNQGSVALSPQELRQALLPGSFTTYIDEKSSEIEAIRHTLRMGKIKADRRMRDAELLLRFIAFYKFIEKYQGDLKEFYDDTCKYYNLNWRSISYEVDEIVSNMQEGYNLAEEIFTREFVFKKWTRDKYENRVNRVLFDLILYYFSDPNIRQSIRLRKSEFEEAFKALCDRPDFRVTIESSTKNLIPTQTRYKMMAETIGNIIEREVNYPKLEALNAKSI